MRKSNIDWTDYSWDPVRGKCPMKCKLPDGRIYCYGHKYYDRFKLNPFLRFDGKELLKPSRREKPSKFFVCSMFELFHPVINDGWRDLIFKEIKLNPHHTFQILTKKPELIDGDLPDNVWLGVTITDAEDLERLVYLREAKAKVKFISFEPMIFSSGNLSTRYHRSIIENIDWIIIGRLTQCGKKYDPPAEWVNNIAKYYKKLGIPVFQKKNLIPIIGKDLIQEYPEPK